MAGLRVFVSSTCFDLGAHRAQLHNYLTRMGYDPILSDHSDVLYDHRVHTHTSCVREVSGADMVILLIGTRFGGKAVPEAKSEVALEDALKSSRKPDAAPEKDNLSVTQLEILKAIELKIPLFVFVDSKVHGDHHVWATNKGRPGSDAIVYPSIQKQETAEFIFGFVDFLNARVSGNAIIPFSSTSDIEEHLSKQWSMLFQRLLREDRDRLAEARRADAILEEIQDLKAAVFQSISTGSSKDIARHVLRFRRLADLLNSIRYLNADLDLAEFQGDFDELLQAFGVNRLAEIDRHRNAMTRTALILSDETYLLIRMPMSRFMQFRTEWSDFSKLKSEDREAVLEGVAETESSTLRLVHHVQNAFDPTDFEPDEVANALAQPLSENVLARYLRDAAEKDE